MKRNLLEAIIYGVLSASFAAAFFLGILSPRQVLKSDVLRVTQPIVYEGHGYDAQDFGQLSDEKKLEIMMHLSPNQIRMKSAIVSYMKR